MSRPDIERIAEQVWGNLRPDYRMDKDVFTLAVGSAIAIYKKTGGEGMTFIQRLERIVNDITLADNFSVKIARDQEVDDGRYYFQIQCWRKDVITGEMGFGYGGKAYLSEHATDSELVQTIFGLYKGYWEHEARESFQWRGRRVFGPHIATEALWEIARRVDVRSARHEGDREGVQPKVDPISESNARQSAFFASLGSRNDRASVTGGSGYSPYDYEEEQ